MDVLNLRLPYIATAITGWLVYILYRKHQSPDILNYWGFRTDNFKQALKIVLPFGLMAIATFAIAGMVRDSINLTWHIAPVLLIYPVWGVIQHFLMMSLFAGNLQDAECIKLNKPAIAILTALLFAIVHFPYLWLVGGTFILALFYVFVFFKQRNLYVLGLFHGWLGALFFYMILNRDPWQEVFGLLLN